MSQNRDHLDYQSVKLNEIFKHRPRLAQRGPRPTPSTSYWFKDESLSSSRGRLVLRKLAKGSIHYFPAVITQNCTHPWSHCQQHGVFALFRQRLNFEVCMLKFLTPCWPCPFLRRKYSAGWMNQTLSGVDTAQRISSQPTDPARSLD